MKLQSLLFLLPFCASLTLHAEEKKTTVAQPHASTEEKKPKSTLQDRMQDEQNNIIITSPDTNEVEILNGQVPEKKDKKKDKN